MKTQDRKEVSLDATNIIDLDTLQLIATRTLLDRMNVPERITLNPFLSRAVFVVVYD